MIPPEVTHISSLNHPPAPLEEEDNTHRSIAIGVACTVLFHLLLVILSPQLALDRFSGVNTGVRANPDKGKFFDFQLDPGKAEEQKKDPFKFVETNPDAPENIPDKTDSFSNRNQQSAQPDPAKEKDPENRPSVKGQEQIKSDAIVTGNMVKPQAGAAAAPEVTKNNTEQETRDQKVRAEQVPLSGFEKREGLSEDGIATNVSKTNTPSNQAQQAVEGARDGKDAEGGLVAVTQNSKPQPKPRPCLTSALPSVVTTRAAGTTTAGITGRDARWSEYGAYLAELEEIVVTQWYRILEESHVSPPRGSHVTITFKINSQGETEIIKVEDADSGKQGVWSCQNAIQARQPYRKWTDQMIAVLGDEQQLVFGFYYQ